MSSALAVDRMETSELYKRAWSELLHVEEPAFDRLGAERRRGAIRNLRAILKELELRGVQMVLFTD